MGIAGNLVHDLVGIPKAPCVHLADYVQLDGEFLRSGGGVREEGQKRLVGRIAVQVALRVIQVASDAQKL